MGYVVDCEWFFKALDKSGFFFQIFSKISFKIYPKNELYPNVLTSIFPFWRAQNFDCTLTWIRINFSLWEKLPKPRYRSACTYVCSFFIWHICIVNLKSESSTYKSRYLNIISYELDFNVSVAHFATVFNFSKLNTEL